MKAKMIFCLFLLFSLSKNLSSQMPLPEERAVQLSATTVADPPTILLSWKSDPGANEYVVYRKSLEAQSWGNPITTLPGGATSFTDTDVEVGIGYEYAFFKEDFSPRVDTVCVPAGTQVSFTINDMYGIGLCCSFGFGSFEVKNCEVVQASGADFGTSDQHIFTVCDDGDGCSEVEIMVNTDMFENSNSWTLQNNVTGEILGTSGAVGSFIKPRPEYGFIYTGIQLPAIEDRGAILLLVDNTLSTPLSDEIQELELDYIKDGWRVLKEEVNPQESVTNVRSMIQNHYNLNSELKAVFLLGHIPIAYSGDIFPDTHFELRGAYPADVYYGEMDGMWTDQSINNTTANFDIYYNTPGDGRFDQDSIPTGVVELQVGRVDFFDMPAFNDSEEDLIKQYLDKNHEFKTRAINPTRRALIDDNFNQSFAAPAASGFRNFSTMFGADSIFQKDYFGTLENESYLWSYGCGGGSIVSSQGVGTTFDFANSDLQSVFTMLFGSQFGNWAYPDNFLRAPLASGQTLTSCWAGNPPWTLHHMAMGHNIGYSTLKTQNGTNDLYLGNGPQLVHVALMGDPTLRMHMVEAPSNISFNKLATSVEIAWFSPTDEEVAGYYIYRSDSLYGQFERINSDPVTSLNFIDTNPNDGGNWYMVKTLKLENSASGSYYNLSLGTIDSVNYSPAIPLVANFSVDQQEDCAPGVINFSDASSGNILSYEWTFDGGVPASSDLQNPQINYNTAGTFDVSLTIIDAWGNASEMKSEFIVIDDVPTVDFSYTVDNGTVTFQNNSQNADSFSWVFGDGNTSNELGDVIHTFDTTGVYTITLTGTNDCGSITYEETISLEITNIFDLNTFGKINIFPNPTEEFLNISFEKRTFETVEIQLVNQLGQLVFSKKINRNKEVEKINVADFPKGIYFVKIDNDVKFFVTRILIQ